MTAQDSPDKKETADATKNSPAKAPAAAPPSAPRRGPGTKEIIPMEWKLVGWSNHVPVTLLKCIDRAEAEAQLERLKNERYYEQLTIYEIDHKLKVSPASAKARKKVIEEAISTVVARNARTKGTKSKPSAKSKASSTVIVPKGTKPARSSKAASKTASKKVPKKPTATKKKSKTAKPSAKSSASAKSAKKKTAKTVKKAAKKAATKRKAVKATVKKKTKSRSTAKTKTTTKKAKRRSSK